MKTLLPPLFLRAVPRRSRFRMRDYSGERIVVAVAAQEARHAFWQHVKLMPDQEKQLQSSL